jgi:hypothetical protein
LSNPLFQARFEITNVVDLGGGTWQISGSILDSSGSGWGPADAAVDDLVFDEDTSIYVGVVNCWIVVGIVSVGPGTSITVNVEYNEPGLPGGTGAPVPCSGAICRFVGNQELSQGPVEGWTQTSETLNNAIRNYDNRRNATLVGFQGFQGLQGSGSGGGGFQGFQGLQGSGGGGGGFQGFQGFQGPATSSYFPSGF